MHLVVLMGGAYRFYEDLRACLDAKLKYISGPCIRIIPHFATISSYKNTASTGELKGLHTLDTMSLEGKNILVVEDMIDTGTTMKAIL